MISSQSVMLKKKIFTLFIKIYLNSIYQNLRYLKKYIQFKTQYKVFFLIDIYSFHMRKLILRLRLKVFFTLIQNKKNQLISSIIYICIKDLTLAPLSI